MKAVELAKAFGYMTEAEIELLQLATALSQTGFRTVLVNIGAGAGTSALAMREALPIAEIYSVDISPGGPLGGLEGERNAFKDADLQPPIQILKDSGMAGSEWDENTLGFIDLLFIDDGHHREDVERDITHWITHVQNGGFIVFHDYGAERWPDVKEVVDDYASRLKWSYWAKDDTLIIFRKGG